MESIKTIIVENEKFTQEHFRKIISDNSDMKNKPIIIFVTLFKNCVEEAFKLKTYKSISNDHISNSNHQVIEKMKLVSLENQQSSKLEKVNTESSPLERYVVKNGNKVHVLNIPDVMCIEADGNYIHLVTNKKKHLVRSTLSGFLKKLDPKKFYRIHKSSIINIDHVDCFEEQLYGDYLVVMKGGQTLKMSRNYSDFLKQI